MGRQKTGDIEAALKQKVQMKMIHSVIAFHGGQIVRGRGDDFCAVGHFALFFKVVRLSRIGEGNPQEVLETFQTDVDIADVLNP